MQPAPVTSTAHFKREQDAKGHIPTSVCSAHLNARVIISKIHCVTTLHCCHTGHAVISIQREGRGEAGDSRLTPAWMTDIARVYCFGLCAGLEVRVAWVLLTVPVCPSLKCPGMYFSPGGKCKPDPEPPSYTPGLSALLFFAPSTLSLLSHASRLVFVYAAMISLAISLELDQVIYVSTLIIQLVKINVFQWPKPWILIQ